MGEEEVFSAAGAKICDFDVRRGHASLLKLGPRHGGQVEAEAGGAGEELIGRPGLFPVSVADFFANFVAASVNRRADGREQLRRLRPEGCGQFRHGLSDDPIECAPPSGVNCRNGFLPRVHEQNREAVCRSDRKQDARLAGDEGVSRGQRIARGPGDPRKAIFDCSVGAFGDAGDADRMNLAKGREGEVTPERAEEPSAVLLDAGARVRSREAQVQVSARSGAQTVGPRAEGVRQPGQLPEPSRREPLHALARIDLKLEVLQTLTLALPREPARSIEFRQSICYRRADYPRNSAAPPRRDTVLSARLIRMIEEHADQLTQTVIQDLQTNPRTEAYHRLPRDEMHNRVYAVYRNLGQCLGHETDEPIEAAYSDLGKRRVAEGVPLSEVVYALVLTKYHLRDYIRSSGLVDSAVSLYQEQELHRLVGHFFDRAIYYTVRGYERESVSRKAPEAVRPSR